MFPTIAEYNQVIQSKGGHAFSSLASLSFIPSRVVPVKIFSYGSGSYAVVFKAKDTDGDYAIRCFISAEQENIDRYRSISQYLKNIKESWVTKTELLENEVSVNGKRYPVIKMEWIEGSLLNLYINSILYDNDLLSSLQEEVVNVSCSLEKNKVGHGDIQCGNIIVSRGRIKLIDYDGMYVPLFSNKANLERGRAEFQHPHRNGQHYNETIDRFSFWVILCALEAIKYDKSLWLEVMQGGFNTLDNLLFRGEDFTSFNSSALVTRLYALHQPSLSYYLNQLNRFCHSPAGIAEAPRLFNRATTPLIPVPNEPVGVTGDEMIDIVSTPAGAAVLTSGFQRLGSTPLQINKQLFLQKSIIVSYGTQFRQVEIRDHHEQIELSFSETTPPPKSFDVNKQVTAPEAPVINLPLQAAASPVAVPAPKNDETVGIVLLLIVVAAIIVLIVLVTSKDNSTSSIETMTDTLVSTADAETIKVDTAIATVSYAAGTDTVATPTQATNSYVSSEGKLVYFSPCYIIVTGAYTYEYQAKSFVQDEVRKGYLNAGYLWIPDYPSLSGKKSFASFIGPFNTYEECENHLRTLHEAGKYWYGKKVSMSYENVEIRIPVEDPAGNYKDDNGATALQVAAYFFSALNKGDCENAWNVTYNPTWEEKGKEWFCSMNAFGGVAKVIVKSSYVSYQTASDVTIYVDYYAEDVYNGNKCFKQNIILKLLEFTNGKKSWAIVKMVNFNEPEYCEGGSVE